MRMKPVGSKGGCKFASSSISVRVSKMHAIFEICCNENLYEAPSVENAVASRNNIRPCGLIGSHVREDV